MRSRYGSIGFILPVPVLMVCLLIILNACSSNGSAPVYTHGITPSSQGQSSASISKKQSPHKRYRSSRTYYLVQPGDTLYSIAWRHYLEHQQLAAWNGIKAPKYPIYPGQRLRLKPPETRRVSKKQPTVTTPTKEGVKRSTPVVQSKKKPAQQSKPKTKVPVKSVPARLTGVTQQKIPIKINWSWPTKGRVVQTFSASDHNRQGIWIRGREGQPIKAAEAGRVVYAGSGLVGYGNLIVIEHGQNYLSAYGYNRKLLVKEGDNLAKGDIVARMGSPNSGEQPVLHFEIRKRGKPINPLPLLPRK